MKIYVAAGEAAEEKKKDRVKLMVPEFHPLLNANVFFCRVFLRSHPVYDQTQGTGAVFS